MANRDFVEKRVMVRGAGKMHEVRIFMLSFSSNIREHDVLNLDIQVEL